MTPTADLPAVPRRASLALSGLVAALGVAVLFGWLLDIPALQSVLPGLVTMKVNTALGLLLAGAALACLSWDPLRTWSRPLAIVLAITVVGIGALTLAEYFFSVDLGIDQWLARNAMTPIAIAQRERMAPVTALCFVLTGSALVMAALRREIGLRVPTVAALAVALITIAGLALLGYASEATLHSLWWIYTGMAVHTVLGFVVFGCALLVFLKSEGGLVWAIGSAVTAGFVAAIAVLLVAAGAVYKSTENLRESEGWVSHTHEVLNELEEVAAAMADLESSQRGYIILGTDDLLAHREQSKLGLREELDRVRWLTADNPRQQLRLTQLEPLIAERTRFGEQTIAARKADGFRSAQEMLATGVGIALSDNIRRLLTEMRDEEGALLGVREAASSAAAAATFLMLPVGLFLCLTLLSLGFFFLNKGVGDRARAELALRESEELFSKAFKLSPDYMVIVRVGDRTVVRANEAICQLWGSTPDDIIGKLSTGFTSWVDDDERTSFIKALQENGEYLNKETQLRINDGRKLTFSISSRMIALKGEPCTLTVMRDVTERKEAEQALRASEERYHSTIDSILESCQLIGFDWRYLYLNDAAAVQNRRPNADLLGRRMPDMWPGIEGSEVFALLRRSMDERSALHDEIEFHFPDGSSGWFDVRSQPVAEGMFVMSVDISERKRAERELRELNETLESKVSARTEELRATLIRAEAADHIKTTFLATMSHELRTPLNSIIGFTGIVLLGLAGPLTAEQTKQLGMVRDSARHLLALINDVLDLSKVEAGQMDVTLETFDLLPVIERAIAQVKPMADKKGLVLRVVPSSDAASITSDRRRVDQILFNLLSNAVKFTAQGEVAVSVATVAGEVPSDPAKSWVHIVVADQGMGIKPEDVASLFQPFHQLDSSLTRAYEGTGLGLAICRLLARLLGGDVHVESSYGVGSAFTLALPVSRGT